MEFTASNFDDAWQFFNIVRNPNITVSNRKRELNSHLTSRSVCIVLPRLDTFLSCPLYVDRCLDFTEQTPVSSGYPRRNSRIYPRFLPQLEKTHETSPRREMRPDSPALCPEQLPFINQTRKEHRFAWLNSRESPTSLSQVEKYTHVTLGMQNCSV